MLHELLEFDPDPIDRHRQSSGLASRLYRPPDLYETALSGWDPACRRDDAVWSFGAALDRSVAVGERFEHAVVGGERVPPHRGAGVLDATNDDVDVLAAGAASSHLRQLLVDVP